ncbi:MAG: ABC transporter permease [Thermogutta sp.]|nr:ABC transporter permease [Thermogutta sp.]
MLERIRRLVIKEFLAIFRDPAGRMVVIVPPLVQLVIFSFAATLEVRNGGLGIYNEDAGLLGRELVARFQSIPVTFSRIVPCESYADVREALDTQRVLAVVHIPQDFTRSLRAGRPPAVQVLLDGRQSNAAAVTQGYCTRIVRDFTLAALDQGAIAGKPATQAIPVTRIWFNESLDPLWSSVPALLGILTNLVALLVTALSVARERELGTFDQLLVSPLRPGEILIGKAVPALVVAYGEGGLMILIAVTLFGLPFRGSLLLLAVALLVFLLAVVGIGLWISSISATQQQAFLGVFTYMVPSILLSGFATPVENIHPAIRWLADIDPLRYMVAISRMIFLENPTPDVVWPYVWPLLPMAAFTLLSSAWFFRHRLD